MVRWSINYGGDAALRRWLHGVVASDGAPRESVGADDADALRSNQSRRRGGGRCATWCGNSAVSRPSIMSVSKFNGARSSVCSVPTAQARPRRSACCADCCRRRRHAARRRHGFAPGARLGAPAHRLRRAKVFTLRPAFGGREFGISSPAPTACAATRSKSASPGRCGNSISASLAICQRRFAGRFQAALGDGRRAFARARAAVSR